MTELCKNVIKSISGDISPVLGNRTPRLKNDVKPRTKTFTLTFAHESQSRWLSPYFCNLSASVSAKTFTWLTEHEGRQAFIKTSRDGSRGGQASSGGTWTSPVALAAVPGLLLAGSVLGKLKGQDSMSATHSLEHGLGSQHSSVRS
jgi:hypothetical protein